MAEAESAALVAVATAQTEAIETTEAYAASELEMGVGGLRATEVRAEAPLSVALDMVEGVNGAPVAWAEAVVVAQGAPSSVAVDLVEVTTAVAKAREPR